jgi:hypothetical protein
VALATALDAAADAALLTVLGHAAVRLVPRVDGGLEAIVSHVSAGPLTDGETRVGAETSTLQAAETRSREGDRCFVRNIGAFSTLDDCRAEEDS